MCVCSVPTSTRGSASKLLLMQVVRLFYVHTHTLEPKTLHDARETLMLFLYPGGGGFSAHHNHTRSYITVEQQQPQQPTTRRRLHRMRNIVCEITWYTHGVRSPKTLLPTISACARRPSYVRDVRAHARVGVSATHSEWQ